MAEKKEGKGRTLTEKLCAILSECGPVAKAGRNTAQNYAYVKESDVAETMRKLFAEHGVFCMPSVEDVQQSTYTTKSGTNMFMTRVRVRYVFLNADDPNDKIEAIHYGDGSDSADKGLYKALTGCHKYALMRMFCLGSDDSDPEVDDETPAPRAPARPPTAGTPVTGDFLLRIPYEEKDKWKGVLYAAGYKWDKDHKAWRGSQEIPELSHFSVEN